MSAATLLLAVLTLASYLRLASLAHAPPHLFQHPPHDPHNSNGGKGGAVASESKLCTKVGIEIMQSGGNVADAAVGTVFCVGVVSMYHSGIGGGGFMLIRSPNGSYDMVDFRETAPAAASENMFRGNVNASLHGPLSSGIPGELRGLEYLNNMYGRLPWKRLLQPAIKIAREGFLVNGDLVRNMDSWPTEFLVDDPAWSLDFAPNGTRVGAGDTITRRRYADTLETIADHGADAFYTGKIARATTSAVARAGGIITLNDLREFAVKIRKPLAITYRDYRITACEAPASGAVLLSTLKLIEGYADIGIPSARNLSTHRVIEALKFGFGMRLNLGDPLFMTGMREYQEDMISVNTATRNRAKISDSHILNLSEYNPEGLQIPHDSGTSHITVAGADDMVITLTTTINNPWGSYIMVPETGVILNNQMNDFSVPDASNGFGYLPAPANFIRPGKTPLSSMTPVIVDHLANSSFYLATGSAGGSRIITAVLQLLWNVLDFGLDPQEAITQPRFHVQLIPAGAIFDYAYNNETVEFVAERGHNVT